MATSRRTRNVKFQAVRQPTAKSQYVMCWKTEIDHLKLSVHLSSHGTRFRNTSLYEIPVTLVSRCSRADQPMATFFSIQTFLSWWLVKLPWQTLTKSHKLIDYYRCQNIDTQHYTSILNPYFHQATLTLVSLCFVTVELSLANSWYSEIAPALHGTRTNPSEGASHRITVVGRFFLEP